MEENKINKNIFEAGLLIGLMTVYGIFSLYNMPYLLLLYPTPFIIYGVKNNFKINAVNIVVSSFIIGLLTEPIIGLFFLIVFGGVTFSINYLIKERRPNIEILGISSAIFFMSIFIFFSFIDPIGNNFIKEVEEGLKLMLTSQVEMLEDLNLSSYELRETIRGLEQAYRQFLLIIPAVFLLLSLGISYINYLLSSISLNRIGIGIVNVPKFYKFKLPSNIVPGMLIIFITLMIMGAMGIEYYEVMVINIVVLISILFFLQGLSIVDFFLVKKLRLLAIIRVIIYIMTLFVAPAISVISILGVADIIFDFRRLKNPK